MAGRGEAQHAPGVVARVGALLRALATTEPGGATTTHVARVAGLTRPTAHRLLGPELWLMGRTAAPRYDVAGLARPALERLSRATGESSFLSARRGHETVCLTQRDGSFPIRSHVLHEGIRFPLGVASAGLAILAHLPADERSGYLASVDLAPAWGPAHDPEALARRVRATRRTGWAVNPGLLVEGSWGMAAAVFDAGGAPAWALSLTGVASRFGPDRRRELGALLLGEAHDLSRRLARRDAVPDRTRS